MVRIDDKKYMERALQLAENGRGYTSPNPMVGAVVVRAGQIVGQGYHARAGLPHAEVNALNQARAEAETKGSTLYVSLEPCCFSGRTPPCTDAIIQAGIDRVVCAVEDPNPKVSGRGIQMLRGAGIDVEVGCMEHEARRLNEFYFKYMRTGVPFVSLKIAQTLDGRIAASNGSSRWISGEESRRCVHGLRSQHDAVLVGVTTVAKDDPELTVRFVEGENPIRIVLDRTLSIPLESRVVIEGGQGRTIVATSDEADSFRKKQLQAKGLDVWSFPMNEGRNFDLKALLKKAAEESITSLLVEGGSEVFSTFLRSRLVDKIYIFLAPIILGSGLSSIGDIGIDTIGGALPLRDFEVQRCGEDVLVTGYVN